jgi:hypothetical protein
MSRKTTKQLLQDFVSNAFKDHEKAQNELIEQIKNNQLTGTFGPSHVEHVQRTESLIKALDYTPEFIESDDFNETSDEKIKEWAKHSYESVKRRENDYLRGGISSTDIYVLSGVAQYRAFLEKLVK